MEALVNLGGLNHIIHSDGRIEKRKSKGFRKTFPDKDGYEKVTVVTDKTYNYAIHRLVWEAFVGPIPEGMTVDHIDGQKTNNSLENLQLLTAEENAIKGNAKHWVLTDPDGNIHQVYNLSKFCKDNGLHGGHMSEVARGYKNQTQCKGWSVRYG